MSLRYFKELDTGDYLAVEDSSRFSANLDALGVFLANRPDTVQVVTVWRDYLRDCCEEVTRRDLPAEWERIFHPRFPD